MEMSSALQNLGYLEISEWFDVVLIKTNIPQVAIDRT